MYEVQIKQVRTEAQRERDRIERQAELAHKRIKETAAIRRNRLAYEARTAAERTEKEAEIAKEEAEKQAEVEQGKVRQIQSVSEREAQSAMSIAREAQFKELRKLDLPITKPSELNIREYISNVDKVRLKAHKTGKEARKEIERVTEDYAVVVDKEKDKILAEIAEQRKGAEAEISERLVESEAEIIKQMAKLNSGIDEWEADSLAKIADAEKKYKQAIEDWLNRPGEEVFDGMQKQGLIPDDAVYKSYDKATGEVSYTVPDFRSGVDIFKEMQDKGILPPNAVYKGYNKETGQIEYGMKYLGYGEPGGIEWEKTETIPIAQPEVASSLAAVGAIAIAPSLQGVGTALVAVPEPITTVIGALILVGVAAATYFTAKRLQEMGASREAVNQAERSQSAGVSITSSDIIVTDIKGVSPFTLQQIERKAITTGIPLEMPKPALTTLPLEQAKSLDTTFPLIQEMWEPSGIPKTKEPPVIMTRFPLENDPALQGKASNMLIAAAAVATITKELPLTKKQWDAVNEAISRGRIAKGREIIEKLADSPSIARSYRLAYEEYLRKKAILDAARKAYIASLNPQPVKGRGSDDARAAAIGIWFVVDVMRKAVSQALAKGESVETALKTAQTQIQEVAETVGLTQTQIKMAFDTVLYEVALQTMVKTAVQAATQAQAQGLTQTQTQTAVQQALQTQIATLTQTAVATQTLTRTQVASLEAALTAAATAVATNIATLTITALPPILPPAIEAEGEGEREKYPDGTIVWKMGELKQGEVWKIIPPPYTLLKPISSRTPPAGVKVIKGTPQETLTFIGDKLPFKNVSFDLGVVDGFIDVKKKKITFSGEGEQTDVGLRLPSPTTGIALRTVRRKKIYPKKKLQSRERKPTPSMATSRR